MIFLRGKTFLRSLEKSNLYHSLFILCRVLAHQRQSSSDAHSRSDCAEISEATLEARACSSVGVSAPPTCAQPESSSADFPTTGWKSLSTGCLVCAFFTVGTMVKYSLNMDTADGRSAKNFKAVFY